MLAQVSGLGETILPFSIAVLLGTIKESTCNKPVVMSPFMSFFNFTQTQNARLHKEIFKVVFLGDGAVGKSEYRRKVSCPCFNVYLS
jgi:hypothetical protein